MKKKPFRIRTSEAGIMLDPVMDIDIGQVEHTGRIVSAEYTSDHVRDIPTEGWSKVVVFADDFTQLLERNVASVSGQDACKTPKGVVSSGSPRSVASRRRGAGMFITMIGECVQGRAGAPAVFIGWRDVLWPTPSTGSDLPWCLPGSDEVVQHKSKVRLEDEEDLDHVFEFAPTGRGSAAESIYNGGSHGEGRGRRGIRKPVVGGQPVL